MEALLSRAARGSLRCPGAFRSNNSTLSSSFQQHRSAACALFAVAPQQQQRLPQQQQQRQVHHHHRACFYENARSSCRPGSFSLFTNATQHQQQQQQLRQQQQLHQQQPLLLRCFSSIPRKLPPNVRIDPRSKLFAPVTRQELEQEGGSTLVVDDYNNDIDDKDKEEEQEDEVQAKNNQVSTLEKWHTKTYEDEEEDDGDDDEYYDDDDDDDEDEELFLPQQDIMYAVPLPDRLNVPVYTLFAPEYDSQVGTIFLDELVFGHEPIRVDLLKRAVNYIRAKKRGKRKVLTKTISTVSGSGRKVRPQKGSGRARAGHSRPPHWRGGAKAHGQKGNTDYGRTKLNKKTRRLALKHALSQKLLEGNLMLVNQLFDFPSSKTKDLYQFLKAHELGDKFKKALIIDSYYPKPGEERTNGSSDGGIIASYQGVPVNFYIASKNIPRLTVGNDQFLNVYRILNHEKLIITLGALEVLEARLRRV